MIYVRDDDERVDVVNVNDEVLRTIYRAEVRRAGFKSFAQRDEYFRATSLLIRRNRCGSLWIPRRSKEKASLPLALDFSTSGYVSSGESYLDALIREVSEEINLIVQTKELRYLGKLTPQIGGAFFTEIYEIEREDEPEYNRDDFCECAWLQPCELLEKLAQGDQAKSDLPLAIKTFYI